MVGLTMFDPCHWDLLTGNSAEQRHSWTQVSCLVKQNIFQLDQLGCAMRPKKWEYPLVMTNIAIENGHL
jgi:hypothetical protein